MTVGCACAGYLMLLAMVLGGFQEPVGNHPPRTEHPPPSGAVRQPPDTRADPAGSPPQGGR